MVLHGNQIALVESLRNSLKKGKKKKRKNTCFHVTLTSALNFFSSTNLTSVTCKL